MTHIGRKCTLLLLIVSMLVIVMKPAQVHAQENFELYFEPGEITINSGNDKSIGIMVNNGSAVNAYDLTVIYDEEIATLVSWSHGTYLSNLAIVIYENEPGRLHIAATQLATPGVSGDGALLNLVFKGELEGVTTLSMQDVEFFTPQGSGMTPALTDGVVVVSQDLNPSATPTRTQTVTPSFTVTPTRTRTSTPNAALTSTALNPIILKTNTPSSSPMMNPVTASTRTASTGAVVIPNTTKKSSTGTPAASLLTTTAGTVNSPIDKTRTDIVQDEMDSRSTLNFVLWSVAVLLTSTIFALTYLLTVRKRNR